MASTGNGLMVVMMDVAPEFEEDFTRWRDEEHIPDLLACPGILSARRFVATQGSPRFLTVYELVSAEALDSPEYRHLRENPSAWTIRMRSQMTGNVRNIYTELPSD